ncbi:NADH dehydrogenase [Brevirhabdus pacifica]|uniref:NADH-quinone oxidoreductase subunit n=1 Tax=Brevirhabdus pacifica TaxID=1267768 RepID=A0A1U7DGS9_9RHOB|nr:NADH-quinone oxidoreductase subunit A [Brevirhabdus pacifica]APX89176.1 NADH dehydrogenase [Brevirhabdus pacifica]PJJ86228.1 NADH dehydrogenase subunit A [Brevirhabdus pacifica]
MDALLIIAAWTGLAALAAWGMQRQAGATAPLAAPFLGGGTPDTHAWQRYHFRPYTMALVFIAFEMEMMFMYPWAVVFVREGAKALAEMGMFLGILSVGLLYGWREGIFRWQ